MTMKGSKFGQQLFLKVKRVTLSLKTWKNPQWNTNRKEEQRGFSL